MTTPDPSHLNDHFFDGQYKQVWRHIIPPGLTEAETDFIIELGQLPTGGLVLDVLCGYGRHALELGRRGYAVTAIDNATEYIAEVNESATREGLPVTGISASVLDGAPGDPFNAVICMGNSFAFFPRETATGLLRSWARALVPGGRLIINTWMIAEIAIRHFRDREWNPMPGYKYLIENRFAFSPTRIESVHTIIPDDGPLEELRAVDYIFTLSELETMFRQAGFHLLNTFSTPRKRPFSLGDGRAYIVAERVSI
jgi:SAM-dependent methyltransferase